MKGGKALHLYSLWPAFADNKSHIRYNVAGACQNASQPVLDQYITYLLSPAALTIFVDFTSVSMSILLS